jgi:hypothetical protein
MRYRLPMAGMAVATVGLGLGLAGCGSDDLSGSCPSGTEPSADGSCVSPSSGGGGSHPDGGHGGGGGGGGIGGHAAADPWSFYGVPWSADSLQNWSIGSPADQSWSYRFRAPKTGTLDHVRVFFIPNPEDLSKTGYADGTGGTVHLEVCSDDGSALHAPDCSAPLGSAEKGDFNLVSGAPQAGYDEASTCFPALPVSPPVALSAGTLYHVVFRNVDPDPASNWIGLDGLIEFDTQTPAPVRPSFTDWGLLIHEQGAWSDWTTPPSETVLDTPVMAVAYDDGTVFGCGYMEVWPSDSQARTVSATERVRETFTASRSLSASGIGVRVRRTGTTGTLGVRLERASGELVAEASIAAASVPADRHGWVSSSFSAPGAIEQGQSYHLVLEGQDGGEFLAHCVRDGQSWTFEPGSVFADGWAEFDRGDGQGFLGWYGWSDQGSPDYRDGDLQFYFTSAEP